MIPNVRFYPCTSPLQESSYSHLMSETLAWLRKSEHEVGGSPELPTQSCLLSLTWFHVRPHLQCGLCLHLLYYTWLWTPTQQHSVNMKQPRKYFPCVLASFGILLILHVISMPLQVTLTINSTPNTPNF